MPDSAVATDEANLGACRGIGGANFQMTWFVANWQWLLSVAANVAQAVTGIVAGIAAAFFFCQRMKRRHKLENYLLRARRSAESPGGEGKGMQTAIHLMGNCAMTEAQVLEAAFASNKIKSWVATDPKTGRADCLFFQFNDTAWQKAKKSN